MNFMRISTCWNMSKDKKHYENDEDELECYGFFMKSKARVTKYDDQSKQQDHLLLEGRPVRILGGMSTQEFGTEVQCETQRWFDPC